MIIQKTAHFSLKIAVKTLENGRIKLKSLSFMHWNVIFNAILIQNDSKVTKGMICTF